MRTTLALGALAFLSFVGCREVTSPTRSIAPTAQARGADYVDCSDPDTPCFESDGLPPPPFRDTMYVAVDEGGSALTGAPEIRVQYFMNKTDNNGWMMFRAQPSGAVLASADAKISFHRGSVTGKGTLSLILPGGILSVDLAKNVGKGTTFPGDCSKGCGAIAISNALFTPKVGRPTSFSGRFVTAPSTTIIVDRGQ